MMVEGISTTQIAGPSHIIKRPRLTKILDETEARIILLCAPAGYGKTTLAREWVATLQEPVFWYSGGPAMADVAALAVDLAELLGGRGTEATERVRLLAKRSESPRRLAKEIAATGSSQRVTLVIDDYQHALGDAEADDLVRELITLSSLRAVVTTRERPSWIDSRMLIYGDAAILGADVLALTPAEAAEILPSDSEVIHLTEGWPALIGLTATRGGTGDLVPELSPAELYDYIASELFAGIGHDTRGALFALAAGADASPVVAEEVLGKDSMAVARGAYESGFATRTSDGWITIHPLLRAFLLSRRTTLDPAGATASLVIETLRRHAMWDECLACLDRFPDPATAARALCEALTGLVDSGRTTTVERWIDFAQTHAFDDPIFRLARAEVALRRGRVVESIALASEAARLLSGELAVRAYLTAARAAQQADDLETSFRYATEAERLAEDGQLRTEALWVALANAYEGAPERMPEVVDRLAKVNDRRPAHGVRRVCAELFLIVASPLGSHREALHVAERMVALSGEVEDPLLRTNALNIHAHLLRTTGDYDRALETSEALADEAKRTGLDFAVGYALLSRAAACVGIRAIGAAQDAIRALESHVSSRHVRANLAIVKAKLKIAVGDLDGAVVMLAHAPDLPTLGVHGEYHAFSAMVNAACGHSDAADAHLAEAMRAPRPRYAEVAANIAAAAAVVRARAGAPADSAQYVQDAFSRGHCDIAVAACRAFPQLAKDAVAGGAAATLERLFSSSNDIDLGRHVGLAMHREHRRNSGLSPREREVYELLVAGLTNPQIANTLFISESTAKVHVRHIYDKLGVHSRAEAATLASEIQASD